MNKILIFGGVGAAVLGAGILYSRTGAQNQQVDNQQSPMSDAAFFSSMAPMSGGNSTVASTVAGATIPSDPANGGSTSAAGGFDMMSVFMTMFDKISSNQNLAHERTTNANVYTSDSAILSTIDLGTWGGTLSAKHENLGTTLTVSPNHATDPIQSIVDSEYHTLLNRAPDDGGMIYWQRALNAGMSIPDLEAHIRDSDEFKKSHQSV